MIKIGITGSIASGKSTVAKIFAAKKYPLFDADTEVKKVYKSSVFKKKFYKKFGFIKKKNIKKHIKILLLNDKSKLKILEKIIHPLVRKELRNFVKKNKKKKFIIFEIPLLIESRLMHLFDKIILVNSKKKFRLNRYLKRGKNKEIFNLLNRRQLSSGKKIKFSDHVINNNGSLKKLRKNVSIIINSYE